MKISSTSKYVFIKDSYLLFITNEYLINIIVYTRGSLYFLTFIFTQLLKFGCCDDQRLFPASSDLNVGVVNHSQLQRYNHQSKRDETGGIISETLKRRLEVTKMVPRRKKSSIHALHSSTSVADFDSLAS